MADKEIKQLLTDMKKREELRGNQLEDINAEMKRLDLRQETETERFMTGIQEDRKAGVYNNITDGKMQQLIDEQIIQIEEKYNTQREEIKQKLEEIKKKHIEQKANDYKQISSQIKDFHLDVVLETNKAQKELRQIEVERDEKIQEIDNKIKEKEAEQTHLIMQNRNFMNIETNGVLGDINALGAEIESLKEEKNTINNEYKTKIHEQNEVVKQYLDQKEKVGAFLGKIRLSEKSIDEIYDILFDKEAIVTLNEQVVLEEPVAEELIVEGTPVAEEQEPVVETSQVEAKLETPETKKTVEEATTTNDINEEELKKIKMAVKEMRALGLDDAQIISQFYRYNAGKLIPMELTEAVNEIIDKYGINSIIEQGLKSNWDRNVDEYEKYKKLIAEGLKPEYEKQESIWDRVKKFIDEHQEELESEQSAEEVSLEKEPIVGKTVIEKTGRKEPVLEELPRPIVTVNIPEQEETVKPIQSFEIKISKNGVKLKVIREGDKIGTVRYDDLDMLIDDDEIDAFDEFDEFKWVNRRIISTIGDTLVVNEIATAVATRLLTFDEGQEQLNNYLALFNGNKKKEEVPLQLQYNLKGIQKSETYSKEGKEKIIKEAKEAKKLGIATVKPGFWIGAKWAIQDFASRFGIELWNKNKGITDGTEYRTDVEQDDLYFEDEPVQTPQQKFAEGIKFDVTQSTIVTNNQEKTAEELNQDLRREMLGDWQMPKEYEPEENLSSVAPGTIFAESEEDKENSDDDFELPF